MASRMSDCIRSKNTGSVVPKSLLPKSREQQAAQRKEKEDWKVAQQEAEKQKKENAKIRVAKQLDTQGGKDLSVLRPDLQPLILPLQQLQQKPEQGLTTLPDHRLGLGPGGPSVTDSPANLKPPTTDCDNMTTTTVKEGYRDHSDDSEDDEELKHLEQELVKKRQEKKAQKTALRRAITAARVESPNESITPIKRPAVGIPEGETESKKRSKLSEIGGLVPAWKSILSAQGKISTAQPPLDVEPIDLGEFGQDDTADTLKIQRAGKSRKLLQRYGLDIVEVKLESVDADLIANEERVTGKPAQLPKSSRRMKTADVPFVNAGDQDVWNTRILPALIEWSGTRQSQFNINADPELRSKVRDLWNIHLATIPPHCLDQKGNTILHCDHPAILSYAQNKLRTYRSHIGRNAMRIVSDYVANNASTVPERQEIVQKLLRNNAFIYEKVGATRDLSSGAWRGELLMQAFAFYITWALSAPKNDLDSISDEPHFPVGALALTAAAVKWALTLWEPGYKITQTGTEEDQLEEYGDSPEAKTKTKRKHSGTPKAPRNHTHSFGERWSSDCNKFQESTTVLAEPK
ncbi:hypothetical protein F5877DRAFT_85189 [Lentinula edodes]|nr:hypothetical protein F5877DRAFT_85189 [Lentinula edodes]